MSAFARWLAGQRIRRAVIIAGLFPLPILGLLSAAVVVMTAALRGPREALLDCLLALALLLGMGFLSGMHLPSLVLSAAVSWAVLTALGSLAGNAGSLTLAVQAAVLLALVAMPVFLAAVGDPVVYWMPKLEAWYSVLATQEMAVAVDLEQLARIMTGARFAFSLLEALLALLLGLRLAYGLTGQSLADGFRLLRLGYVLGGIAAVAGIAALVGMQLNGVLLIFGMAFGCQGVAVLAWWARQRNWPRSWWWALVIAPLVLTPLLVIELALLAGIGFVDNWFGLRREPPGAGAG